MITICIWIFLYVRPRNRDYNVSWSPPPINVHLHGFETNALTRTQSHYRSHRTMSECDQCQPSAEDKSLKSGVHTYNVIDNREGNLTNGDTSAIFTVDAKRSEDSRSTEISGKMSDPFPMIPNPLYRTTSCVIEKRGPMPLPSDVDGSTGKGGRKDSRLHLSVHGAGKSKLSETNSRRSPDRKPRGSSDQQPDSSIQSVRSKSCDPLRYIDHPPNKDWCHLDSLDNLDNLGRGTTLSDDVFGAPDYSLLGNQSARSRSYSLFHLPQNPSHQCPASSVPRRRGNSGTSRTQGLGGVTPASERYEMIVNPLVQPPPCILGDELEKTPVSETGKTDGYLKSSSQDETKFFQHAIVDDEGYQTFTDAGGGTQSQESPEIREYTDLK
ncbi:uncharacterized protein LOC121417836 [Lytechinus variegatus]|uniref:uncharacterized protein LOC121417836 n=1 Tax=Lytechinus variegatus TaxID=7654 RepID=UPI001BB11A09|nr:uncharacterized protein LOC121417836 [Lytechinus variegatus]